MLKKLLLLSLVCFCFSPAFAQGGKLIKAGADAARSGKVISEAISAQVARQVAQSQATAASVRLAQITNMPGTPVIKMQVDETLFPGQELTVRAISREKLHQTIYPGTGLKYLPESFNQKSPVLFRGMGLWSMNEVKTILTTGLEKGRTFTWKIYFSSDQRIALDYSKFDDSFLPVMIKMQITSKLLNEYIIYHEGQNIYVSIEDVPAHFLTDVMVLLEVNGEPGWYKAVLENDEIKFIPASSRVFENNEIVSWPTGKFGIPSFYSE